MSARLPGLRVFHTNGRDDGLVAPKLVEYVGPYGRMPGPGVPLRVVRLAGRWPDDAGARLRERGIHWGTHSWANHSDPAAFVSLGEPESFGAVTLQLPDWFRRVPTPPEASRDGAEVLATWAEWGDGDPRDRVSPIGPAWVRLERLPHPVRATEAAAALSAPPPEVEPSAGWRPGERMAGPPAFRVTQAHAAGTRLYRARWTRRRAALWLLAEIPHHRAADFHLAAVVGQTLRGR